MVAQPTSSRAVIPVVTLHEMPEALAVSSVAQVRQLMQLAKSPVVQIQSETMTLEMYRNAR